MTGVRLYPHQQIAIDKLDNGKVLYGGTGVGKSITAAAYYMQREAPRDVYVITTAKKRDSLDWEKEFAPFKVGKERNATFAGVLTVDSWNNIRNYVNVKDAFFIFDEQRVVGSGTWTKSFVKIARANRWILLSATPGDTWLDYIPVFVANGFYKNRTAFKDEHVIYASWSKHPKVERYVGTGKLNAYRNQILVPMPYERHTVRKTEYITVDHDEERLHRAMVQRWNVYESRPIRDVAELFSVMRKVVNSDPSRLDAVKCLMQKHPKLIVFYNFDYELEMLRTLGSTEATSKVISQEERPSSQKTSSSSSTPAFPDLRTSQQNDQLIQELLPPSKTSSGSSVSSSRCGSGSGSSTLHTAGESSQNDCPILLESSKQGDADENGSEGSTSRSSPSSTRSRTSTSTSTPLVTKKADGGSSVDPTGQSDTLTIPTGGRSEWNGSTTDGPTSAQDAGCGCSSGTATPVSIAEWNGHKHEPIPQTDRWVYLVQYVAGAEGWNCTETDAMVFFSLTYSYKNFHQAYGRIDRLNTPFKELNYYVLKSKTFIDSAIMKALKEKRNFNESSTGIKI
jgi:hypothetical protein